MTMVAEGERTDPYRWYCRLCGTTGDGTDQVEVVKAAGAHIAPDQPCGRGETVMAEVAGRLMHVWTYT